MSLNVKIAGIPLSKIVAFLLAAIPVVGGVLHGYLYIEDQRRLMENIQGMVKNINETLANEANRQENWLKLDQAEYERQETLRGEIRQAMSLLESQQVQQITILQDLERGHEYIARQQAEMVYRFGLHAGRHSVIDTMRRD